MRSRCASNPEQSAEALHLVVNFDAARWLRGRVEFLDRGSELFARVVVTRAPRESDFELVRVSQGALPPSGDGGDGDGEVRRRRERGSAACCRWRG
jgi:hypothetical protein